MIVSSAKFNELLKKLGLENTPVGIGFRYGQDWKITGMYGNIVHELNSIWERIDGIEKHLGIKYAVNPATKGYVKAKKAKKSK